MLSRFIRVPVSQKDHPTQLDDCLEPDPHNRAYRHLKHESLGTEATLAVEYLDGNPKIGGTVRHASANNDPPTAVTVFDWLLDTITKKIEAAEIEEKNRHFYTYIPALLQEPASRVFTVIQQPKKKGGRRKLPLHVLFRILVTRVEGGGSHQRHQDGPQYSIKPRRREIGW